MVPAILRTTTIATSWVAFGAGPEPTTELASIPTDRVAITSNARISANRDIVVLVLSFSSPETLSSVLDAVERQTVRPVLTLVVDNAGEPPVTLSGTSSDNPLLVDRLSSNLGPAGGWAYALGRFLEQEVGTWAWLLDDDTVPEPDCLERLLEAATGAPSYYPAPLVLDSETHEIRAYPSWCGPLLSREIIQRAGLPLADLVWWTEDTEYLSVRMNRLDIHRTVVRDAVVTHHGLRRSIARSPARIYYESRNGLWMRLHVRKQWRHPTKWWRVVRIVPRYVGLSFLSPTPIEALRALAIGLWDGARARLGRRYELAEGRLRSPAGER